MSHLRRASAFALAFCLAMQPGSAAAITVEAPSSVAEQVYDALKDGVQATDLTDAAFSAFWSAVGDVIANTDICRQANEALGTDSGGADGPDARFNLSVTVTGGSSPVTYSQLMHVSTYRDFDSEIIVIALVKPDGTYGRKIECARGSARMPARPLDSPVEETTGGAQSFAFQTEYGRIITYLPDDIRAGDTISGTVYIEPNGDDNPTRQANAARLSGYVVDVAGVETRVQEGALTFVLGASTGRLIPLVLSEGENIIGAATLEAGPAMASITEAAVPAVVQAGSPASIAGPFDGNVANTQAQLGTTPIPIIAESPRQAVVMCPQTPTGPATVHVNDGGRVFSGPTNNIAINLTAPRTTLARGESTRVTLQVVGLQGLQASVNVALWASPTVNLQGGNTQMLAIAPRDANGAGEFERRFQLRVVSPGPFDITATLQP